MVDPSLFFESLPDVPGDPGPVRVAAAKLHGASTVCLDQANKLDRTVRGIFEGGHWKAPNAFLYAYAVDQTVAHLRAVGGTLRSAGTVLDTYAGRLEKAKHVRDQAQRQLNRAKEEAGIAALTPLGFLESFNPDFKAAQTAADQAVQFAKQAAAVARAELEMLAGLPVHKPPPLPRPKPREHHWYDGVMNVVDDFEQGLYQGTLAPLKLGLQLSPLNAIQDPQNWLQTVQGVGKGLLNDVEHPDDFLKQLVDWNDWTGGHPARAVGQLLPNVLLAIFTGGGGAAADGADAAVDGTTAAARGLDAAGNAADASIQSLAADAARILTEDPAELNPLFDGEDIPNNPNNWLGGRSTVKYLTDDELTKYRVTFSSDGKLLDATGQPLDTSTASNFAGQNKAIYVVDKDGNVFVSLEQQRGVFHHSSLGQGLPVAGAGEIQVEDGVLQFLNRQSGHYRPTPTQLAQVEQWFKANGVDFSQAVVDFGV